jgi:Raf kinase inhibitor-like YbhB/YbcL family protein
MTRDKQPEHAGSLITILKVRPYESGGIVMASAAFDVDGRIDPIYTPAGDGISPPLEWNAVLEAETFALVVEDPDAPGKDPFVHWLMWNIPGKLTALPQGIEKTAFPKSQIEGAVQGRNGFREHGWFGPKPPPGSGLHHYHFQLFALSTRLDHLGAETPLAVLTNALKGSTIAMGDLVGMFEARG